LRLTSEGPLSTRASGQLGLLLASLRTRAWAPASILTTCGLLAGLFCFYVGARIGPLSSLVGASLGLAAAIWTVAMGAVTSARLFDQRVRTAKGGAGFGRMLRVIAEHKTGVPRRTAIWLGGGLGGLWLCGVGVMACSVAGLAGQAGRAAMAALLGVQVLLFIGGMVWLTVTLAAVMTQPVLICSRRADRNRRLFDALRLWGAESPVRNRLLAASFGLVAVLVTGGFLLRVGYGAVLMLNGSVAGDAHRQILAASPLAPLVGIPLASEPSLSQQIAGILATLSLAGAAGLLLGIAAAYWGASSLAVSSHPDLARWLSSAKPSAPSER
jgi:hypothetical protein